jgi:hypothetical protein
MTPESPATWVESERSLLGEPSRARRTTYSPQRSCLRLVNRRAQPRRLLPAPVFGKSLDARTNGRGLRPLCLLRVTPHCPGYDSSHEHTENGKEQKERGERIPRPFPLHRLSSDPDKYCGSPQPNQNIQSEDKNASEWSHRSKFY